ncbi:MAG: hypothetical protein WCJ35_24320 [Planctomycetota bacterium]
MNARHAFFAMFALSSLAASVFAQDWTSEATYTKTVTTTTVTTYAPSYPTSGYMQPWNNGQDSAPAYNPVPQSQPTVVQTNYAQAAMQPTYAAPAYSDAINLQPNYTQPAYTQATYSQSSHVQPTYVSYRQPVYAPVTYTRAVYMQTNVRPVVYNPPTFVGRPVMADYYTPVYRPVVAGYTPTYVANPAACEVRVARPVVSAAPAGPKVWVHEKVYVQGQPLRNLLTAITP